MAEFLPLCDLLFNIVSLAAYFCDIVFDLLMVYALYDTGPTIIFVQCVMAIVISSIVTQLVSINWHFKRKNKKDRTKGITENIVIAIHFLQLAMLWRYAKLLAPVKLEYVKKDVRDLCVLRLIHAFVQAAPMLLLQLSLLPAANGALGAPKVGPPADLVVVSAALSLFTVCWALASFSKHVQAVDRLILTWLGVISQLLWRAGTVSARTLALSAYASTYHSWIFLVLALHWSCMFLWLVSPRSAFYGEKGKRLGLCFLLAAVYVFTYVNLQNKPHIRTMTVFYVVMLLENVLLVSAWLAAVWNARPVHWIMIPVLTVGLFVTGLFFMILYYRFFHVRRLLNPNNNPEGISLDNKQAPNAQSYNNINQQTPGVFNCRFATASGSSAAYRKKKKPTSFVPPPNLGGTNHAPSGVFGTGITIFGGNGTTMAVAVPFWRRPLPSSSENEGSSVGSRVNIHQKLQEKKQKQLAELKIIEEEIKQGKLVGPDAHLLHPLSPSGAGDPNTSSFLNSNDHLLLHHHRTRQPIPRAKRHMEPQLISLASLNNLASYGVNLNRCRPPPVPPQPRGVPPMNVLPSPVGNNQIRSRTPPTELLLTPRYLFYDVGSRNDQIGPRNGPDPGQMDVGNLGELAENLGQLGANSNDGGSNSDIESQLSLPRSYTLPREFKYHRRGGGPPSRRPLTAVASTNSSDGDVDSAGDDESDSCYNSPAPPVAICPIRRPFRHETKL